MTSSAKGRLPGRTVSSSLVGPAGQAVVKIDELPIERGQRITLTFEVVGPRWRQGVFLAMAGQLVIGDTVSPQVVLWSDVAPRETIIEVAETDGRLVLYNVWDSGRGFGRWESQSYTSGMLVEKLAEGSKRYRCTDIGLEPDFGVFPKKWRP